MIVKNYIMCTVYMIFTVLFNCSPLFPTEQPTMVIQLGHSREINTVCFSPDGRYILSGSSDNTISLWDVYTGKEMRKLIGHTGWVYSVCFSPDGEYAVSAGRDYLIKLWKVKTGEEIKTFTDKTAHILSVKFARDGRSVFLARSDATIMLLDISTGNVTRMYSGHTSFVNAIAVSPDGKSILSGGGDKKVILRDIDNETIEKVFRGHTMGVNAVAFSPDNKYILSGGGFVNKAELILWNRDSGEKIKSYIGHNGYITSVHFSADGTYIVSTSYDKTIKTWDLSTGKEIQTLTAHSNAINTACFSPDFSYFLSSDGGRNSILWETNTWKEIRRFKNYSRNIDLVCYSPDGRYIVTESRPNIITLWDKEQCHKIRNIIDHNNEIRSIRFSPDSTKLISGGTDRMVKLWDIKTGECLTSLKGHKDTVSSVCFSPDGNYALSGAWDNYAILWDIEAEKSIYTLEGHSERVTAVAFSPDGNSLISGSEDKTINIWKIEPEFHFQTFQFTKHNGKVTSVCISPDGKQLLAGGYDYRLIEYPDGTKFSPGFNHKAILWDIKTEEMLHTFSGHTFAVTSVCFSHDAKKVYTGSQDSTIKCWDTATGGEIWTNKEHLDAINQIDISPCGNYLISGSNDTRAIIHDLSTGEVVSLVESDNLADWLIYSNDGYWDSSGEGGQLVAMVRGMDAWNIDQFAVKNNRPDILLKKIGSQDNILINHYYKQYQKRLKKLKIYEDALLKTPQVPEVFIKNITAKGNGATLQCLFKDTHYSIISYNIYVNDVPLFGAYGKPISGKEITIKEQIELSCGDNKIEVSCFNETGAESYRALTHAAYNKEVRGDLYFIGFGVSEYKDSALNLKYAHKDVKDLADLFCTMKSSYRKIHIRTYLNNEVTPSNIENAREFVKNSSVNDTFVLFISGHGVHDSDDYATYYYLTHQTDIRNLAQTAAKFELIESLLQEVNVRKKLFLMDTCESGEIDEDVQSNYFEMARVKGLAPRTTKKGVLELNREKRPYLLHNLDRYIYNDLLRRSGAIVFSSSRGGEFSYESDRCSNGLFTEAIISALGDKKTDTDGDGIVMIDELKKYVCNRVSEMTGGMQNPTIDRDNIYLKFGFPAGE